MKVVLLSPYLKGRDYGLRILSSCLKKEGHDVKLAFIPKYFAERYDQKELDDITEFSKEAGLIGISVTTNYFNNAAQITQNLKEELDVPIIWGGMHATVMPDESLRYADMACVGEGEEALVELTGKMENGEAFHDVEGIWFNNGESIVRNKVRPLIQDLDAIPFPDHDFKSHYVLLQGRMQKMEEKVLKKWFGTRYQVFSVRGCPFSCTYCCNNTYNAMYPGQKVLRKRNIDSLIEEIVEAKKSLPFIERVNIGDDDFFVRTEEEIKDFAEKYKDKVNLFLRVNGVTPATVSREKLESLPEAGMVHIRMGIQTASERTKKLYNRCFSNEQIEKSASILSGFKNDIEKPSVGYDIILDNPWETEEDLIDTLMFLTRLSPPYKLDLFSLTLYPGTELYSKAEKEGIINADFKDGYTKGTFDGVEDTYLNRLFFLQREYAWVGKRISSQIMFLLTNRTLRNLKISQLLYSLMFARIHLFGTLTKKAKRYRWKKGTNSGSFTRRIKALDRGILGRYG